MSCQVLRKAEDKESKDADVESVNEKEESLPVARATWCWKRFVLKILQRTGDLFIRFPWQVIKVTVEAAEPKSHFSSSETWILPSATFFVMLVYTGLALSFYNSDG